MNLSGQWTGRYDAPVPGKLAVDVDYAGDGYSLFARLNPDDKQVPSTSASLNIPPQPNHFIVEGVRIFPINPDTGEVDYAGVVKQQFTSMIFSTSATVKGSWSDTELSLEWMTDLGVKGSASLPGTGSSGPSDYVATSTGWDQFKAIVGAYENRRYIYRGQSKPWLSTGFQA